MQFTIVATHLSLITTCACFVFKPVENCIKEENEEDFVQLSAMCSPHNGKDRRDSFSTLWSQPRHSSKMATSVHLSHLKNLLNSDYVDPNRPAIDVDNHHSIGRNTEQSTTTSTDEECSSLMLLAPGDVSRTDVGENTFRKLSEISESVSHFVHFVTFFVFHATTEYGSTKVMLISTF